MIAISANLALWAAKYTYVLSGQDHKLLKRGPVLDHVSKYFNYILTSKHHEGNFPGGLVVKISISNAGSAGSILSKGTRVPHASWPKTQNIKQKQYCNKFNKDFKNDLLPKKSF